MIPFISIVAGPLMPKSSRASLSVTRWTRASTNRVELIPSLANAAMSHGVSRDDAISAIIAVPDPPLECSSGPLSTTQDRPGDSVPIFLRL